MQKPIKQGNWNSTYNLSYTQYLIHNSHNIIISYFLLKISLSKNDMLLFVIDTGKLKYEQYKMSILQSIFSNPTYKWSLQAITFTRAFMIWQKVRFEFSSSFLLTKLHPCPGEFQIYLPVYFSRFSLILLYIKEGYLLKLVEPHKNRFPLPGKSSKEA